MRSAARFWIIRTASSGENTLSSARTGVATLAVTNFIPSKSWAFTGCSTKSISIPESSMALIMRTASLAVQPWLASMRRRISGPTAARISRILSISFTPSFPTLIFRIRKPCLTAFKLSSTISSTPLTLMVRSVSTSVLLPPRTRYNGFLQDWAYRS